MLADLMQLTPLLSVAALGLVVMLVDVFVDRSKPRAFLGYLAASGFGAALVMTWLQFDSEAIAMTTPYLGTRLAADSFALYGNSIVLIGGIFTALSSIAHLPEQRCEWGEYYSLLVFAVFGMMVMISAVELITLFVGLEIMSIAVYVLAGFKRQSPFAVEAAMKYFFLGAFATGFLLYGIAFVYGDTGTTELVALQQYYAQNEPGTFGVVILLLMIVAFGFKTATAPFHMWTPDVYEGAPSPITGLMAAGVKTASFLAMARVFIVIFDGTNWESAGIRWEEVFFWLAIVTMSVGNILALAQRNVKRMLAYSSIAHAGYLLIGVLGVHTVGGQSVVGSGLFFYLLGYVLASVGAFAVISMLGKNQIEDITFGHLGALATKAPGAAVAMSIFMFSLAGIPPTAGFMGKYLVFAQAMSTSDTYLALIVVAVLNSTVSVYYYLRVLVYMYMRPDQEEAQLIQSIPLTASYALPAVLVLAIGLFPAMHIDMASKASSTTATLPNYVVDTAVTEMPVEPQLGAVPASQPHTATAQVDPDPLPAD